MLDSLGRVKYISATSQNAIIDVCNSVLFYEIIGKVSEAKFFTVLTDETSDISGTKQVFICVRYIDNKYFTLYEDYIKFVLTTNRTGRGLAILILKS